MFLTTCRTSSTLYSALGAATVSIAMACEAPERPGDTAKADPIAGMAASGVGAGAGSGGNGAAATSSDHPAAAGSAASSAGTMVTGGGGAGGSGGRVDSGGVGGNEAPQGGGGGSTPPNAPPQEPDMPVVCPASGPQSGDSTVTLTHDGISRSFLLFVPNGYDNTRPFPLVLNFHGGRQYAAQERRFSKMNATAEAKGFIVVYPEGVNGVWDAGACCSSEPVDDVGFARAIVEYMREHACIDPRRVYSTGMSNGGRMTYRLGCEAADIFAAIAPVAGIKSFPDLDNTPGCMPSRPISLIDFQGTADTSHFPYQAPQIAEWVAFNGCTDAQPTETYRQSDHYCSTYSECEAGTSVTFCVVPGGGHCWPGSYPCALGDSAMPDELSANELMWELFERSTLEP